MNSIDQLVVGKEYTLEMNPKHKESCQTPPFRYLGVISESNRNKAVFANKCKDGIEYMDTYQINPENILEVKKDLVRINGEPQESFDWNLPNSVGFGYEMFSRLQAMWNSILPRREVNA